MQQSLFEDEIDALHAHSRQLSAALDAQHAQRAAATHKTEAFVRAVGERMRGLQEGLADAQKAAALVGTAEDAEKRRKAFIIEGLSQEVDLLTKCASPSSSPSVADLHSRADNLPQH